MIDIEYDRDRLALVDPAGRCVDGNTYVDGHQWSKIFYPSGELNK